MFLCLSNQSSVLVLVCKVPVIKELRYLFARFYMFCMVPGVQDELDGCPESEALNLALLCLTGLMMVLLFFCHVAIRRCFKAVDKVAEVEHRASLCCNQKLP
jgi:hypothetical protein